MQGLSCTTRSDACELKRSAIVLIAIWTMPSSVPFFPECTSPIASRAGAAAASKMGGEGPQSRAQGRFTVITDGEILTNNSEDGAAPNPAGREVHWEVGPGSSKIPETLIRLQ